MRGNEDCRELELISLHIPKAGGSALLRWLKQVYGRKAIYHDSNDNPANLSSYFHTAPDEYLKIFANGYPFLRGKKAVHGHFWMKKYQYIKKDIPRITFLRNPISRIISAYWNFKTYCEGKENSVFEKFKPVGNLIRRYRVWSRKMRNGHNPMNTYFFREKPSLLESARLPLYRNYYSFTFFGDFGPEMYDFIGNYSRLDDEIERLKTLLGVDSNIGLLDENITSKKADGYMEFKESVLNDPATMGRLKEILADDIAFYERHAGK